jgi:hypothetical protein
VAFAHGTLQQVFVLWRPVRDTLFLTQLCRSVDDRYPGEGWYYGSGPRHDPQILRRSSHHPRFVSAIVPHRRKQYAEICAEPLFVSHTRVCSHMARAHGAGGRRSGGTRGCASTSRFYMGQTPWRAIGSAAGMLLLWLKERVGVCGWRCGIQNVDSNLSVPEE